ncbi:MAG: MFS transporter [Paracoccaceae bacterium]|nr:MFS transporter [Paracoccaceae bacterium]
MGYLSFLRVNWRWLLAAFLLAFSSSYGQTFFISLFAGQIRDEFGLSHGAWGGIYSLATTASALLMVWAGGLTDRFRVRRIGPVVLVALAIACLAMAAVPSAAALVAVIFALRFTGQGMTSHIAMVGVARWFVATRGRAMAIAALGFAAGNAVMPILFVALMSVFSWRSLWVLAAGMAVIFVPILLILLDKERTPQSISKSDSAPGMNGEHWKRHEMLRHWLFWLMLPTFIGPAAWGTAMFFQQVHLTEVKGWSLTAFVALFPLFTLTNIATSFATGWAIDRFGSGRVMSFYAVPYILTFVVMATANDLATASVAMMVFGIATGMGQALPGAFMAEHYGTRYIGSIKALSTALMVFGSAIGPGITGWLIDRGIMFPDQMFGIAAYFAVAGVMVLVGTTRARALLSGATQVNVERA